MKDNGIAASKLKNKLTFCINPSVKVPTDVTLAKTQQNLMSGTLWFS